MSESGSKAGGIIIATIIGGALISGITMYATAGRVDHSTQAGVTDLGSKFVTEAQTSGVITPQMDAEFVQSLNSFGDFSREVEISKLNDNPGKKTQQSEIDKIGENVSVTEYTTQYEKDLESGNIVLKKGDQIKVTIKQQSPSNAETIKSGLLKTTTRDTAKVIATQSAMINVDGNTGK